MIAWLSMAANDLLIALHFSCYEVETLTQFVTDNTQCQNAETKYVLLTTNEWAAGN